MAVADAFRRALGRGLLAVALAASGAGCRPALNYTDAGGPRYAGAFARPHPTPVFKVVTFNIRFAREIERAEELFQTNERLRDAQVIALQEMDAAGTENLARALGYDYVYYPAVFHPTAGHDFGNAILSRLPIEADHKLILPHGSGLRGMQRVAVAADLRLGDARLRVYSVHLGTPAEVMPQSRVDQALAIVADARSAPGPVIVAGDFNNRDLVGRVFENADFQWVSRDLGHTLRFFCWDHVFVRGLGPPPDSGRGIVIDNNGASDHLPVWAELVVAPSEGLVPGTGRVTSN
jgi:endonuclease/exonuclease/phosphatase family metal-dependent hydrolase